MKPYSQAWLEELNLAPLWRERGGADAGATNHGSDTSEDVAPASLPATSENNLRQGIHSRGYLPHLKAEGGIYFVTFRLADSLPQSALDELKQLPKEARSKAIEAHLDDGHGACLLSNPKIAQLIMHTLKTFDGERYVLHDWVVMPNHVHLVIEPRGEHSLSDILHSLKSYTATEANRALGRQGPFWQHESYDRLLRDQKEFDRCVQYVQQNPVKAKLAAAAEEYAYGRAGFVIGKENLADEVLETTEVAGKDAGATVIEPSVANIIPEPQAVASASLPATTSVINIQELDWSQLQQAVATCTLCPLHTNRTQAVFGVGAAQADILFVGEAPGEEEDLQGEPFVGQAGQLLDNMLASIDLNRKQKVYITNVVKCRPLDNRNPEQDAVHACAPYLDRQIALIEPKLIVALGKAAATRLLGKEATIASLRGQLLEYQGRPLIVTYHPAYLLRTLQDKAKAWEDLCLIQRTLHNLQNA